MTALRSRLALPGAQGDSMLIGLAALAAIFVAALFTLSAYAISPFALPALFFALGFFLLVIHRPYLGVAGAFLAAPLESLHVPLPTGALSPAEGALVLVGLLYLCRLAIAPETIQLPKARDLSLFVLLGCVAIGLVTAVDVAPVMRVLLIWSLFVCVYFQAQSFTAAQMRIVVGALIVGAGLLGAIGAVSYLRSGNAVLYSGGTATGARAAGTFADPNYYASLLQLALLPPLALLLANVRRNLWMAPFVVATLLGLAFSLSRGGALGFAVGLLVLLLWRRARWFAVGIAVLFTALTLANANPLVGSTQVSNVTQRLSTVTQVGESSTNNRPLIWKLAFTTAEAHPFFGVGVNQFQHQAALHGVTERGTPLENAHNIPLSLMAELGFIGFAAFFTFVGQIAVRARRGLKSGSPLSRALTLGLAASLAGFLIQGLTAAQIRDNLLMGTFLAFAGMITGIADRERAIGEAVRNAQIPSVP